MASLNPPVGTVMGKVCPCVSAPIVYNWGKLVVSPEQILGRGNQSAAGVVGDNVLRVAPVPDCPSAAHLWQQSSVNNGRINVPVGFRPELLAKGW